MRLGNQRALRHLTKLKLPSYMPFVAGQVALVSDCRDSCSSPDALPTVGGLSVEHACPSNTALSTDLLFLELLESIGYAVAFARPLSCCVMTGYPTPSSHPRSGSSHRCAH